MRVPVSSVARFVLLFTTFIADGLAMCQYLSPLHACHQFWLEQSAMRGRSDLNGKQQRRKWVIKLEVSKSVCCILMAVARARRII